MGYLVVVPPFSHELAAAAFCLSASHSKNEFVEFYLGLADSCPLSETSLLRLAVAIR